MFSKTSKIEKIENKMEELLYNEREIEKMRKKQREIFERGEERFLRELKKICEN
jgi:hypothetical protein